MMITKNLLSGSEKNFPELFENILSKIFENIEDVPELLKSAMKYAVSGGGKRVRPRLFYLSASALKGRKNSAFGPREAALMSAALEMIHSYSLVHDDMPQMDNDILRRGKAAVHVQYGEANALLTGDALLNFAGELLLRAVYFRASSEDSDMASVRSVIRASEIISSKAGPSGMIAGQVMDLSAVGKSVSIEYLKEMDLKKTSCLIGAAVMGGGALSGASEEELRLLESFSDALGLCFQIKDDILDVSSNSEIMGKTTGKDERDDKPSYVRLLGLEKAKELAARLTEEAISMLDGLDGADWDAQALADFSFALLNRAK